MASPQVVDLDKLTQPISDDTPHGTNIREDRSSSSDYYAIKDARNGARAAERANMFDDDENVDTLSLWKPVIDIAPKILSETSKDLEVLCWYIEALIRYHNFTGLRDGLTVTCKVVEQYWDKLYPEPDEDGLETKVAPLTALNGDSGEGTLLAPIRNCLITTTGSGDVFSYWQYQQARSASKIANEDEKQDRFNSLGFNLHSIENAINSGSIDFYANLIEDLEICNEQFLSLNELLIKRCGNEAPPTTRIKELLDEVLRSMRFLTKDKLATLNKGEGESMNNNASNSGTTNTAVNATGPINNREHALAQLQEVAQYFRQHEPHSLLSPAIERIVVWGRLPVAELMMELIPDNSARGLMTQLTGVKLDGSDTHQYVAPTPVAAVETPPVESNPQVEDKNEGDDLSW